jgi:Rieske Fe-S protein
VSCGGALAERIENPVDHHRCHTDPPATDAPGTGPADATPGPAVNRRAVLAVGGVAGASAALLVVGTSGVANAAAARIRSTRTATGAAATAPAPAATAPAAPGGAVLGPASAVPVGGGVVYPARKVVVTQPSGGQFRGFSAICTHQGCTVGSVSGGTINCPCHGSRYRISDGSVVHGPAPRPLPPMRVTDDGGTLHLG